MSEAPLTYLVGAGARAYPVVWLTWGVIAISVAVMTIIAVLVLWSVLRARRSSGGNSSVAATPIERSGTGLSWIYIGVGISLVALVFTTVWTMYTLAGVISPRQKPALTIKITGHQWWWEGRYVSGTPDKIFNTANEFHIPTGKPVRFLLQSADVIHSFWVPRLSGKTDAIPGQTNSMWLEADKPGVYRGQCAEYCGTQHAKMGFEVVAQSPEDFAKWRAHMLAPAENPPADSSAARGEAMFTSTCGGCHTVRGTLAKGAMGPELTHLMERRTIAAGTLPNTPGNLAGWIADPQHVKPGTQMPTMPLSGPELQHIVTYLRTLG